MAFDNFKVRKEDGESLGELSLSDIIQKIKRGHLVSDDEVYVEDLSAWQALQNCKSIQKQAINFLNQQGSKNQQEIQWFALKGENCFGPFSYFEMISMLQQKDLQEFDFAWREGLISWKRIAELTEFSEEEMKFIMTVFGYSEAFYRRKHQRMPYEAQILVHNNADLFHGESLELSAGGAGVVINNPTLHPGDTIKLHFKPGKDLPAFNARCEIVSKSFLKDVETEDQPTRYGLKFLQIDSVVVKQLDQLAKKGA